MSAQLPDLLTRRQLPALRAWAFLLQRWAVQLPLVLLLRWHSLQTLPAWLRELPGYWLRAVPGGTVLGWGPVQVPDWDVPGYQWPMPVLSLRLCDLSQRPGLLRMRQFLLPVN